MQAHSKTSDAERARYRPQLIEGFCSAVEEAGYAATTIADIVRQARVSKRTFYEQFADKEECFMAAYAAQAEQLMQGMAAAVDPGAAWEDQVDAAISAYLTLLDERPALTRAFFLSIHVAGPRALALRREVMERFAELTRALVELGRPRRPEVRSLSPTMAMAIVGAINELVLLKAEQGTATRLIDLTETAVELVSAVLAAKPVKRRRAR